MKARVVTWEGGDPAEVQASIDEIRARAGSGPPEGVPAVGLLFLQGEGRVMVISLFDNEDDLRQGDATLNSMSPPSDMGSRSVEFYDVPIKLDAERSAS